MPDKQFQNGAEVQLKSGGPRMTVVGYDEYNLGDPEKTYKCRWFDDKNKLAEDYFTEAALKPAASASGGTRLERA
jgi:uncharacterized protein YodC (DUF2158 family)